MLLKLAAGVVWRAGEEPHNAGGRDDNQKGNEMCCHILGMEEVITGAVVTSVWWRGRKWNDGENISGKEAP